MIKAGFSAVVVALLVASASLTAAAGAAEAPKFTAGPEATRDGDKVKITFAVSAFTDVQVSVIDGQDKVVRRLAAGLLGKNAPAAFQKDSLRQEVVWDGKDDAGQAVLAGPRGPFKVRVAIGLAAHYAGPAFGTEPKANELTNVIGMAAGPEGQVYVLSQRWNRLWWTQTSIHVFKRGGEYEKTIRPFAQTLPAEKLAKLTPLKDEQGLAVPIIHRVLAMDYYPGEDCPQHMAVGPDGNLHLLNFPLSYIGDRQYRPERYIASLAPDGGLAYDHYLGADLKAETMDVGDTYLAASADGARLFVTGMNITIKKEWDPDEPRPQKINVPAVFAVDLPGRAAAKPFFGDPAKAGKDESHLSDPRGLASDGQGNLLVADFANDRIVVLSEKDGKFVKAYEVKAPTWVAVARPTKAIYVATEGAVVKFVEEGGKLAAKGRLELPAASAKERASTKWSFALDAQADSANLWVGRNRGGEALVRCQEKDGKFGDLVKAGYEPTRHYWSIAAGFDGKTVACKTGDRTLRILDEDTGQTRQLKLDDSGGQTYRLGPDNQIYGMDHSVGIRRWDAQGKPLPFPAGVSEGGNKGKLKNGPSGTTDWERDFAVDRAGNLSVKQRGKYYHGRMTVDKYDKDGKLLGTVIWVVSDGAQGPRLDSAGNLYLAESLKPAGEPFPEFFKGKLPAAKVDHGSDVTGQYRWMYGSAVKFAPTGGAVWFPIANPKTDLYPFDGEAKLPPDQPKVKVDTVTGDRVVVRTGELQGAEWLRFGVSYILDMHPACNRRCHCTATGFETDEYGRVYYTDQGRFRVVVLDTNGNELLAVGGYGNQDSFGKEGTPQVAFNWFTGLAASDRYIYVADGGNLRVVRLALKHAAEQTCPIK